MPRRNPMSATLCAKVTFPLTADSPIRPASSAERGRLIAEACVGAVAEICAEEFGE